MRTNHTSPFVARQNTPPIIFARQKWYILRAKYNTNHVCPFVVRHNSQPIIRN